MPAEKFKKIKGYSYNPKKCKVVLKLSPELIDDIESLYQRGIIKAPTSNEAWNVVIKAGIIETRKELKEKNIARKKVT